MIRSHLSTVALILGPIRGPAEGGLWHFPVQSGRQNVSISWLAATHFEKAPYSGMERRQWIVPAHLTLLISHRFGTRWPSIVAKRPQEEAVPFINMSEPISQWNIARYLKILPPFTL